MDESSDTVSTSTFDYLRKTATSENERDRMVTVKFATNDGKVFTQSYTESTTIKEIKSILVEVFAIPFDSIVIKKDKSIVSDDNHLNQFQLGDYNILEFELTSSKLGQTISAQDAYEHFSIPDVITVRVDDSDEEDGYRDVVVEIINSTIDKPFLGGYVDTESGIEYHHGYSQTGPPNPKVPPENKNHRDTQTYFLRNRLLDTHYARATQMSNEEVWIPNVTDKILTAGPYETAEEWEKRRAVERKVRTIQRYFRAWKMRKALKVLSAEYKKRIRLEQEMLEFNLKDEEVQKKRELIGKVFPRTKDDFCMLFSMVDRWKKAEIKRICNSYSGPAKMTAFYVLLDKEVQMLRAIENHRQQMKKDIKLQKDREFFQIIGNPIAWNTHYKDWKEDYKDLYIEMDTLETQQGHEYYKIYLSISDTKADLEDRLQALLNVKLLLHDHNCQLSNELVNLVDRACELMVRGLTNKQLDMLMKRIQSLFMKHIKTPECSFGVTNRLLRVKEKLMNTDLFYCNRCQKLKSHTEFAIHSGIDKLKVCISCSWDDRVMEPWFELAPNRFMLRLIRREERMKQSPSSVVFILQDRDIHYIVNKIWHGHSALSEKGDIYNLRLCRWFRDLPWAPWNCVLLTLEEIKLHLQIDNLEKVYDKHFICRVFNKHELAKAHFRNVLKLDRHFEEFGECENRWNEIKNFIEFVPVNSKTKIFLSCH